MFVTSDVVSGFPGDPASFMHPRLTRSFQGVCGDTILGEVEGPRVYSCILCPCASASCDSYS